MTRPMSKALRLCSLLAVAMVAGAIVPAQADAELQPGFQLSATSLIRGGSVTATGSGCTTASVPGADADSLRVTVREQSGRLSSVGKPKADGTWSVELALHEADDRFVPGGYVRIQARCGSGDAGWDYSADLLPTFDPYGPVDVTVVSASERVKVSSAVQAKLTVTGAGAGIEARAQFIKDGVWTDSDSGTTTAGGQVSLPLSFAQDTAGDYLWRVVATVDGKALTSRVQLLRRMSDYVEFEGLCGRVYVDMAQDAPSSYVFSWQRDDGSTAQESHSPGEKWSFPTASDSLTVGHKPTDAGSTQTTAVEMNSQRCLTILNPSKAVATADTGSAYSATVRIGLERPVPSTKVSLQVKQGNTWVTTGSALTDHRGRVDLPLSYAQDLPGTHTWRVVAKPGGVEFVSAEQELTRQGYTTVVLSAPNSAKVGATATARVGVPGGGAGHKVLIQFSVAGRWATSQSGVTGANGQVVIPLTYGRNTAEAYEYRAVLADDPTSYRPTYRLVRVPDLHVRSAPGLVATGQPSAAQFYLPGYANSIAIQFLVNGKWSTSQRALYPGGATSLNLTYGINQPGRYTWRALVDWHGVMITSPSYVLERVKLSVSVVSAPKTAKVYSYLNPKRYVQPKVTAKVPRVLPGQEVYLTYYSGGTWVIIGSARPNSRGVVELPLWVNESIAGRTTWRVFVAGLGTAAYSGSYVLTRTR